MVRNRRHTACFRMKPANMAPLAAMPTHETILSQIEFYFVGTKRFHA